MNNPPNKTKRLALMLSSGIDTLIGAVALLIGFKLVPVDITQYGLQPWHAILFGALFFLMGVVVFAYNVSRLEE
jgi:hypothetical protein